MKHLTIFLPAACIIPTWLLISIREELFIESFTKFYPLTLAMVLGSMIAGSTPLGGGVVAFPVSVLLIGFSPSKGRDFSLMIQSIGMTAASFLIFIKKSHLLDGYGDVMAMFCCFSLLGLMVGFFFTISPYVVNLIYTISVACFAIGLAYRDFLKNKHPPMNESSVANIAPSIDNHGYLKWVCIPIFAIAGGFLSSNIGTGADMAWFAFGSIIPLKNSLQKSTNYDTTTRENTLTAISVIIMAFTSVFGSLLRITVTKDSNDALPPVHHDVYMALIACAPIVCLGAPVGSLLLTASNQRRLKHCFFFLAFLQLMMFGIIKISDDTIAWMCVVGVLLALSLLIICHYFLVHMKKSTLTKRNRRDDIEQ